MDEEQEQGIKCPKCHEYAPLLACERDDHFIVGCTHCHNVWHMNKPKACPACEGTGIEKG
jgi:ssDNA-binding Zn-finger/Zn-ribbon topoisomerase 1